METRCEFCTPWIAERRISCAPGTATGTRIKRIQDSTLDQICVGCILLQPAPVSVSDNKHGVCCACRKHTCAGFAEAATYDGLTTVLLGTHVSGKGRRYTHTHTHTHTHNSYILRIHKCVIKTVGCATCSNYTYNNLVHNSTNILQKYYKSFYT